jgi:hypothetical protein
MSIAFYANLIAFMLNLSGPARKFGARREIARRSMRDRTAGIDAQAVVPKELPINLLTTHKIYTKIRMPKQFTVYTRGDIRSWQHRDDDGSMRFHRKRPEQRQTMHRNDRLSLGSALLVIAVCSVLSWLVVILIGMALLRFGV